MRAVDGQALTQDVPEAGLRLAARVMAQAAEQVAEQAVGLATGPLALTPFNSIFLDVR